MKIDCDKCLLEFCDGYVCFGNPAGSSVTSNTGLPDLILLTEKRTTVEWLGNNKIRLTVPGYKTTQLNPFTSCVTAFPPLETVASVDAVTNIDGRTGEPFTEVEFNRSFGADGAVTELARSEGMTTDDKPWFAFQSNIIGTVADGVPNHFTIDMTLTAGTRLPAFLEELQSTGAFLTSGSDEAGRPNHHPFFREIGNGPILVQAAPLIGFPEPHRPPESERLAQ